MKINNENEIQYDQDKLDEIALALIYLNAKEAGDAWKSIPWSATDRLHTEGYIHNPRSKSKSFILTDKGRIKARELFLKHFTDEQVTATDFPDPIVLEQNSENDHTLNLSLYELMNAFESTDWKRKFFLNLETGAIEESFPAALVGGIWLAIPGYASKKRSDDENDAQEEILTWLKLNRIVLG
jgi:hypothetical protein